MDGWSVGQSLYHSYVVPQNRKNRTPLKNIYNGSHTTNKKQTRTIQTNAIIQKASITHVNVVLINKHWIREYKE